MFIDSFHFYSYSVFLFICLSFQIYFIFFIIFYLQFWIFLSNIFICPNISFCLPNELSVATKIFVIKREKEILSL